MADFTRKPKNWVKGSARLKEFAEGGFLINVDLNLKDLERLPVNEAGYVKIVLAKRKSTDEYGNDFQIYENDWKPDPNKAKGPIQRPVTSGRAPAKDDLPFSID